MDAPIEYKNFIGTIKERIRSAQYEALKAVNKELLGLYWDIGNMIFEKREELGWGRSVVENIAKDLRSEFPGQRGFSSTNLWLMVQYYSEYQYVTNLQSLTGEISFTSNVLIFTKCKDSSSREFYLKATKKFGWSTRILDHQIDNNTYERYMLQQTNYNDKNQRQFENQRSLAIKDHYIFDFLELTEEHSERQLEKGLIRNMQQFLYELGGEYSYIGSQYKIKVGNTDFYIDLLLFHRRLQCLVVIELKAGPFKPEYKGKLEFYLNVLNDTQKLPHENDAVGIIICKTKDRLVVEYSLIKTHNSIGIASYSTGPDLPEYYERALPSAEQIERGLALL